jgi:hypothetical protein
MTRSQRADLVAGLPWDVAVRGMMKEADMMVLLISGGLTSWAMREIDAARNSKLPIVPVVIGIMSELPQQIEGLKHVNLKESAKPDEIAHAASEITSAIKVLRHKKTAS